MIAIAEKMRDYGKAQQQRFTLPNLAIDVAEAAAAGDINADDAMDLYIEYFKTSSGLRKPEENWPTVKSNASKLRQIIRAADPALLKKVIKLYDEAVSGLNYSPRSLYPVMVDVCRWVNEHNGQRPADQTIISLARKKR